MENLNWSVTYTNRAGESNQVIIVWPQKPSAHHAAIAIRDKLLPDDFLLPDIPRNSTESCAVLLLRSYGFEIVSIEEAWPDPETPNGL